jgi:hypothetical protein
VPASPSEDTELLRAQVDDAVRALIRTQHVVSLSGNVFTGGLEEPVFDIHITAQDPPQLVRFTFLII